MRALKTTLHAYIRAKHPFILSLDEVHTIAKGLGRKQRTAERRLNESESPEIKTHYDDKGQITGYSYRKEYM